MLRARPVPTVFQMTTTIAGLWAFAVVAPLFEKLRGTPDFLITQKLDVVDMYLFVTLWAIAPIIILGLVIHLCRRISPPLGRLALGAIGCILFTLLALPILSLAFESTTIVGCLALTLGAFLGWALFLFERFRGLISTFSLALPLFLGLFVTTEGLTTLFLPQRESLEPPVPGAHSDTPVVVLLLDELPLNSLLNQEREIDSVRFPGFAELAKQTTWYRNTTAVSTHTVLAVPAILSGIFPRREQRFPTLQNHPRNLFTLLKDTHEINRSTVIESVTDLCPHSLCQTTRTSGRLTDVLRDTGAVYLRILLPYDTRLGLPDVSSNWGGFWRGKGAPDGALPDDRDGGRIPLMRSFLRGLSQPTQRPPLIVSHVLLPHSPWQLSPEGRLLDGRTHFRGYIQDAWSSDDWARTQAYQRFLWQVKATDTLLLEWIQRLKELQIWDNALVIVTADHGVTFAPGSPRRGNPMYPSFVDDVLSVPLFVKLPQQRLGRTDTRPAESIDILPTIAEYLVLGTNWQFDGRSLLEPSQQPRVVHKMMIGVKRSQRLLTNEDKSYKVIEFPIREFAYETIDWKIERFGPSVADPYDIQRIGVAPRLVGRELTSLQLVSAAMSRGEVAVSTPRLSSNSSGTTRLPKPASGVVPAVIEGVVIEGNSDRRGVAVVVGNRIEAVVPTYQGTKPDRPRFSALLSESAALSGQGIQFYELLPNDRLAPLRVRKNP